MTEIATIQRLAAPPPGFENVIADIGVGLGKLYGPVAEEEYSRSAMAHFQTSLAHKSVYSFGAFVDGNLVGFLAIVLRRGVARVILGHISREAGGCGYERPLVTQAMQTVAEERPDRIHAEFVPYGAFDESVFGDLGFRTAKRLVMFAPAAAFESEPAPSSVEMGLADTGSAARVLCKTYENHPSLWLHPEAQHIDAARDFIELAIQGGYGEVPQGAIRVTKSEGQVVGFALGAKAAAGVGFILHVAVHPDYQQHRRGEGLVRDVAKAFAGSGYTRLGLGVTVGNPAQRLYERLGFEATCELNAHVAWAGPGGTWSLPARHVP